MEEPSPREPTRTQTNTENVFIPEMTAPITTEFSRTTPFRERRLTGGAMEDGIKEKGETIKWKERGSSINQTNEFMKGNT